jgi:hypothetical protein
VAKGPSVCDALGSADWPDQASWPSVDTYKSAAAADKEQDAAMKKTKSNVRMVGSGVRRQILGTHHLPKS